MTAAAARLERGLAELGCELSEEQAAKLLELAELTRAWGERLNLTGHRTSERIVERLILDAVALHRALPELEAGSLVDLGSGAGYPGLPLAILYPGLQVTLVEARERRHHFQKAARRALGLENATPRLGRAEALAPSPHAAVIAQAMAAPEQVLEWMLPWAAPGAWLILPGGVDVPELPADSRALFEPAPPRRYQVPLGGPARTLWLARAAR